MGKKATQRALVPVGTTFVSEMGNQAAKAKAEATKPHVAKSFVTNVTRASISRNPWLSALVNPFDSEAVQLPDEYAGGSIPLKLIEDVDISIDANGHAMVGILPSLKTQYQVATAIDAAGIITTVGTAADHPDYADCSTQFGAMRTLVYGIEIISTLSENENQGRICVVTSIAMPTYLVATGTVKSCFDDASNPLPLRDGLLVVVRPSQPPRFEAVTSGAMGSYTFPCTTIAISGAKPNSKVSMRVVKLMEAQPTKNSLHRGSMTVEPYDLFTMSAASNMALHEPAVHPNTPAGHKDMKADAESLAEEAIRFLAASLTSLGILPPGIAAAGAAAYDTARKAISRRKMRH